MKRVLSLISVITALCILLSCMVIDVSAEPAQEPQPPYYVHYPVTMVMAGMPKTIKAQFDYDPDYIEIAADYPHRNHLPSYNGVGYAFPLATEKYNNLYDVDYTVNDTVITYTYTLKSGVTFDDYLNALDAINEANDADPVSREDGARHAFSIFDIAMKFEDTTFLDFLAKVVDNKMLEVVTTDGRLLDVTTNMQNSEVYCHYDMTFLPEPDAPDVPAETIAVKEYKYRDKLLSQYQIRKSSLSGYDELYEHKDENGEVDWALVKGSKDCAISEEWNETAYYEFGNRVMETDYPQVPFAFGMGVYSVKHDRFFDVNAPELYELDDLERVWTEIGAGRLMGDMDDNNRLEIIDAVMIQRCQARTAYYPYADENSYSNQNADPIKYFSDFDQDGERSIMDATTIQRYLANLSYRPDGWTPYPHRQKPDIVTPTQEEATLPFIEDPTTPTEPTPTEPVPTEPAPTESDDPIPRITGFRSLGKGVEIHLSTVKGAEKYRVYYWSKANNTWKSMGETTTNIFIDDDVAVGTSYLYTVRCIKADLSAFTSDFDHAGWTYTYDPHLDTPQITDMEAVSNGVRIKWSAVDGADLYRVYYQGPWGGAWQKVTDTRDTSCLHTNASFGTIRYYVRCLSCKGKDFASEYQTGPLLEYEETPTVSELVTRADRMEIRVTRNNNTNGKVRLYRKDSAGWTRIGEQDYFESAIRTGYYSFYDDSVEAGKSYTYTARIISNGKYFTSWYNTSGKSGKYSIENYVPEFEFIIYTGDNMMLVQAKENKFGLDRYQLDIYDDDTDTWGWVILDSEPHYIRADEITDSKRLTLYLTGIDQNGKQLSAEDIKGYHAIMVSPPQDLTVTKLGDRKYRFKWSNDRFGCNLNLISDYGEYMIDSGYIRTIGRSTYDVDLSDYPEDVQWTCIVWNCTQDGVCCSMPISLAFSEADYQ